LWEALHCDAGHLPPPAALILLSTAHHNGHGKIGKSWGDVENVLD